MVAMELSSFVVAVEMLIDLWLPWQVPEGDGQQSPVTGQETCQREHTAQHNDDRQHNDTGGNSHDRLAERQLNHKDILLQDPETHDCDPRHTQPSGQRDHHQFGQRQRGGEEV